MMKKIICWVMTLAAMIGTSIVSAAALDTNITVRVGLYYESTALSEARLENVDTTGYTIGYYEGETFVPKQAVSASQLTIKLQNNAFVVSDTASGAMLFTGTAGADQLAIQPNSRLTWHKGYKWYGNFMFRRASNGNIAVINYVNIEDYVKGVLPYEMSADWSIEALKAQAVCARSYVLGSLDKHGQYGFDVCNTTNCQVYRGANSATDNSDSAVDLTCGEYLSYNGEPVVGFFFSSDGGATENATNVWGGEYGYLQGVEDPYEDVANALNGKWLITLSATDIQQKLRDAGYSIGTVANVQVTKRTETDNVNEVTVTDMSGKSVTISRSACRTVFGLNSIRYTITPVGGSAAASLSVLTSVPSVSATAVQVSQHKVKVDGNAVQPRGYLIAGNNYFKLRDLATVLDGTKGQFSVGWDAAKNAISLTGDAAYEPVGGELSAATAVENVSPSTAKIIVNGKSVTLAGYNINGNNYYRVRDIGTLLGFGVDFDNDSATVMITGRTASDTTSVTGAASYAFDGTGWGHSVGMSQYGALAMAKQGFSYEEILKFYYTGIEIGR